MRLAAQADAIVIGDRSLLKGAPHVEHVPLARPVTPGKLDPANARYVLAVLDRAIRGCMEGEYAAMVTAPVQKSVINDAGIAFTGHTEYLAEHSKTSDVVMMLVGAGLRVALATTHLPLIEVPRAITRNCVRTALRVLDADLKRRFRIARPRILVAGLNPHSGESGHMGREDIDAIVCRGPDEVYTHHQRIGQLLGNEHSKVRVDHVISIFLARLRIAAGAGRLP